MTKAAHETLPDSLTQAEMDDYVEAGTAERWQTIMPGGRLPIAAIVHPVWRNDPKQGWLLDSGTWYVVREGDEEQLFRPASERQAAVFTDAMQRMRTADDAVARADAASARTHQVEEP